MMELKTLRIVEKYIPDPIHLMEEAAKYQLAVRYGAGNYIFDRITQTQRKGETIEVEFIAWVKVTTR